MTVDEMKAEAKLNGDKEIGDCCQRPIGYQPPHYYTPREPNPAYAYGGSAEGQEMRRVQSTPAVVVDDNGRTHYRSVEEAIRTFPHLLHDQHLGGVED